MQTVDELGAFQRRLEAALAEERSCECEVCTERQGERCWATVLAWLGVSQAEQMAWLDAHPPEEPQGHALRVLLEWAARSHDLGALQAELDARRPQEAR